MFTSQTTREDCKMGKPFPPDKLLGISGKHLLPEKVEPKGTCQAVIGKLFVSFTGTTWKMLQAQ